MKTLDSDMHIHSEVHGPMGLRNTSAKKVLAG